MENAQVNKAGSLLEPLTGSDSPAQRRHFRWRSHLESIVIPFGAIVVSLVAFGAFCALAGANPSAVYASIYKAAFGSWYSFQNTLVRAAPLMLCSLGTAIPFQLGLVMIGSEGALVIGGLCATIAALQFPTASPLMVQVVMAGVGMVTGGLWLAIAGGLKHYRGVNETISSLMMNYIAIALLNQAINTWVRDPSSLNKPASYPIPDEQMLQPLGDTTIHWGLVFGLIACLLAWVLISQTTLGFQIRTIGGNVRAAQIAGIPVGRITLITCFLAGACPGLAGMVEVAAVHGRANESLNAWYGYSGILVAFLARHNPLGCILISILLGGLLASGGILQRDQHLPDAAIMVFQGLVFLVILFSESLYGRWKIFREIEA
jgi:general nucleoside transport system permease protein